MSSTLSKLNPFKTGFLFIGFLQQLKKLTNPQPIISTNLCCFNIITLYDNSRDIRCIRDIIDQTTACSPTLWYFHCHSEVITTHRTTPFNSISLPIKLIVFDVCCHQNSYKFHHTAPFSNIFICNLNDKLNKKCYL